MDLDTINNKLHLILYVIVLNTVLLGLLYSAVLTVDIVQEDTHTIEYKDTSHERNSDVSVAIEEDIILSSGTNTVETKFTKVTEPVYLVYAFDGNDYVQKVEDASTIEKQFETPKSTELDVYIQPVNNVDADMKTQIEYINLSQPE